MADMQQPKKVEEVAEEQVPPPRSADPAVVDGGDDTVLELPENEAVAKIESTDDLGGGGGFHLQPTMKLQNKAASVDESVVETTSVSTSSTTMVREERGVIVTTGSTSVEEERESGVEVIEVEYDSTKEVIELDLDSFHAHNPHCPNCNHRITKIILRKKNIPAPAVGVLEYYCNVCVEVVKTVVSHLESSTIIRKLRTLRYPEPASNVSDPSGKEDTSAGATTPPAAIVIEENKSSVKKIQPPLPNVIVPNTAHDEDTKNDKPVPITPKPVPNETPTDDESDNEPEKDRHDEPQQSGGYSILFNICIDPRMLLEILKCIVYGGLIESITSFSVVASAAATDATTLNVFAIGLAMLFSGLIAFILNLQELKNRKSNKQYRELLGNKKEKYYFSFHAPLALLSYLVFGLVAPATYAFAFREGDCRRCKILAAAAAALACIFLLAMAKAHVSEEKDKRRCYIESTRYYLGLAVFVSVVAYAMGFLVEMLALEMGLFASVQRVTCYVPQSTPASTLY